MKIKTYVQIHKMAVKYWDVIAEGLNITPISDMTLRERLKKSFIFLESQQRLSFSYFLNLTNERAVSADKMMNKARDPARKARERSIFMDSLNKMETACPVLRNHFR